MMNKYAVSQAAFYRLSELMTRMIDAGVHGEKEKVLRLSESFFPETDMFVEALYGITGITPDMIDNYEASKISDENLLKQASSESPSKQLILANKLDNLRRATASGKIPESSQRLARRRSE